jgi:hypothetical protein
VLSVQPVENIHVFRHMGRTFGHRLLGMPGRDVVVGAGVRVEVRVEVKGMAAAVEIVVGVKVEVYVARTVEIVEVVIV